MNWEQFFQDYNIHYVTRGNNVKSGNINIRCPFCGDDDPSEHMGVSITKDAWACWRSSEHRGKDPVWLIQALLGCSKAQASLIKGQTGGSSPDALSEALACLERTSAPPEPVEGPPEEPPQMQPIYVTHFARGDNIIKKRFWDYLKNRGFNNPRKLIKRYRLTCCNTGRLKDRIIVPVYRGGELLAWTGRALIDPKEAPRYLSSKNIKTTVFNEDELRTVKAKLLFICEGPFDALKLDFYGKQYGARATCTFGTNVTMPQIIILNSLIKNFDYARVFFDHDAFPQANELANWLNIAIQWDPAFKDPGSMDESWVHHAINQNLKYVT